MLKPDYSRVTDLFLAYPYGFDKYYHSFTPFFEELISLVPDDIHLYLIANNKKATQRIHELFPNKNIDVVEIKGFYELWLRDIMGFNCGEHIIKPIFKPDYYKDVYTKSYLEKIDRQVREIIATTIKKEVINIPLIWDCGNLMTNGKVSFITDKILRDNKTLSKLEIETIIREYTGTEPIVIPTSKYDKLGHSDGYISFINEMTVCLASYPFDNAHIKDNLYINELEDILKDNALNIMRSFEKTVDEKSRDGNDFLYSAEGCYVNNIILNGRLILPVYSLSSIEESKYFNQKNISVFKKYFNSLITINSNCIAKDGGVLRCLAFVN